MRNNSFWNSSIRLSPGPNIIPASARWGNLKPIRRYYKKFTNRLKKNRFMYWYNACVSNKEIGYKRRTMHNLFSCGWLQDITYIEASCRPYNQMQMAMKRLQKYFWEWEWYDSWLYDQETGEYLYARLHKGSCWCIRSVKRQPSWTMMYSLRPCFSTAELVPILCRILLQNSCPSSCKP